VIPTTAGEAFSEICAKALPIWRRVSILLESSARAETELMESKNIKKAEINVLCEDTLRLPFRILASLSSEHLKF
jgi:hypothetical protein